MESFSIVFFLRINHEMKVLYLYGPGPATWGPFFDIVF